MVLSSPLLATRLQSCVQSCVDQAVNRSMHSFAKDVHAQYESVESLLEAIGMGISDVFDKVDQRIVKQSKQGSSKERKNSFLLDRLKTTSPTMGLNAFLDHTLPQHGLHAEEKEWNQDDEEQSDDEEVIRLRNALCTVSLLARRAQEEIASERAQLDAQIASLQSQVNEKQMIIDSLRGQLQQTI